MSDSTAVTIYQGQDESPPNGLWDAVRHFFKPAPADPVLSRLERLDHISARTWLPGPTRQEIGQCIAKGRTILSLRESAADSLDPWDVERIAAIWQTDADGLIHRGRMVSILSGIAEVALFAGLMMLLLHLAGTYLADMPTAKGNTTVQRLESVIKSYLPASWNTTTAPATGTATQPSRAEMFVATLKLASVAAAATFAITTAILLFWSRGPRRWGMIFALTVCSPAIVIFATLSYTLAHQINQYHQAVLKRESAEIALVETQKELRETKEQLAYEKSAAQSFNKDAKAFNIAFHAIEKGNPAAATQALTQISKHFAPALPAIQAKTQDNDVLTAAISTSLGNLRHLLSIPQSPPDDGKSDSPTGQGKTKADAEESPPPAPLPFANGKANVKSAMAQTIDQHKVVAEIDRLRRLQQRLDNSQDAQLSRQVAYLVVGEAAENASIPEIREALLEYVLDLSLNAQKAGDLARSRTDELTTRATDLSDQITALKKKLATASDAELQEYSDVRNSLGDVSTLILGTSPLLKKKTDNSGDPADTTTQKTLAAIDNVTHVLVAITMALLMFVCANEVIFVVCVGVMVLLLPMLIHSLFGDRSRSWLAGTFGRVLMVLGGLWLLVMLAKGGYWLLASLAEWAVR